MKTLGQKLIEADKIISETEHMFVIQKKWWITRSENDLDKLRDQSNKVKTLIDMYKKPEQKL